MFGLLGLPMLYGALAGGGINILRGKNPLKGALLGGALGGLGGMFSPAVAGTAGATGTATSGAVLPGTVESMGLVFNPATGTYLAPEAFLGASTAFPVFTGGEGLLSNAFGNISSSIPSSVKDYMTPQNMIGVANMAMQNQAPLQNIGGTAQARPGQAPSYTPFQTGEVLSPWKKRGQA